MQPLRHTLRGTRVQSGRRHQSGFSLIEAMVALLIFGTGVLGITRLQSVAVQQTSTAAFRTQAALLAKNLIATMWLSDRTPANFLANFGGTGAGYTAWKTTVINSGLPGVTATTNAPVVTLSQPLGGGATPVASNQVTVVVYWQAPGDQQAHYYTETAQIK